MKHVIEVKITHGSQLRIKINAFKILYGRDPEFSFHGVVEDTAGELCFCETGCQILNVSHDREILTLDIDAEPVEVLISTQSENSRIYMS